MDGKGHKSKKRITFYGRILLVLILGGPLAAGAYAHIRATGSVATTEPIARAAPVLRLPTLDRVLTYRVDAITVEEPTDVDALLPV